MKKEKISQNEVKWSTVENFDQTRVSQHAYYGLDRVDNNAGKWTGETHRGNGALCNKNWGISEDGDYYLPIEHIIPENQSGIACRSCIKIYESLS